jgi:hypothetical protein
MLISSPQSPDEADTAGRKEANAFKQAQPFARHLLTENRERHLNPCRIRFPKGLYACFSASPVGAVA